MTDCEEKTLRAIEAAIAAGARCPMNDQLPGPLTPLVRAGKIRVEVYNKNFRRVTMLVGLFVGRSTQEAPKRNGEDARPYLVSDATGTFRNGTPVLNAPTKSFRNGKPASDRPITLPFKDGKRVG